MIKGTCPVHGSDIPAIVDSNGTPLCQVCGERVRVMMHDFQDGFCTVCGESEIYYEYR